jgi:hypothetical protein
MLELHTKYPTLAPEPVFVECGSGWDTIICNLCDALVRVVRPENQFRFLQIKEKFGGLRVYTSYADTTLEQDHAITRAVDEAERASWHTCEVCGAPGESVSYRGYARTLCPWHELLVARQVIREQSLAYQVKQYEVKDG